MERKFLSKKSAIIRFILAKIVDFFFNNPIDMHHFSTNLSNA